VLACLNVIHGLLQVHKVHCRLDRYLDREILVVFETLSWQTGRELIVISHRDECRLRRVYTGVDFDLVLGFVIVRDPSWHHHVRVARIDQLVVELVTLATLDDRRDGLGDRYLDFPSTLRILKGVDRSVCSLYVLGILVLVQDLIRVAFDTDLWILVEIRQWIRSNLLIVLINKILVETYCAERN
jgi:hypothetical protein